MSDSNVEWFQKKLVPYSTGLLMPDEEARFRSLLAEDSRCAALYEGLGLGEDEIADAHHLPAEMIARWGVAQRELRGLERELVAQHLSECGQCRDDLALLGHSWELESASEPSRDSAPDGPGMWYGLFESLRSLVVSPARWVPTAAVVVAAVVFLLLPRGTEAPIYLSNSLPMAPVVKLSNDSRSFGIPEVEVESGATVFGVDISGLGNALGADPSKEKLTLSVVDPDGNVFSLGSLTAAEIREKAITIGNGREAVLNGEYALELTVDTPGREPFVRKLRFRIVRPSQ